MCFGSGSSASDRSAFETDNVNLGRSRSTPAASPNPDPGAAQATGIWNQRRRVQNSVTDILPSDAANDGSPTTALKKLMGA